ncbi:unnamed protein product, partial [Allacma fusca]
MDSTISELVSKDGISFRTIAKSSALRRLFKSEFGNLPKCHTAIRRRFMAYGEQIQTEKIAQIQKYLAGGGKYSLTIDEWTAKNNRRYLNINIHDKNSFRLNLGLEPIPTEFTSVECLRLVKKRLSKYGIDLLTHIVGCTNDGASIMQKYGHISG